MTINDKIGDKKLQHDTDKGAAIISALSSGKIEKYEYFTGEEMVPPVRGQMIEQPNLKIFI